MNRQTKTTINLQSLPISSITPYPNNPKEHTDAQIDLIWRSMQIAGYNQPIVVDENNVIICGHGRLLALKKYLSSNHNNVKGNGSNDVDVVDGNINIDVVVVSNLTDSQKREARILDNSTNQMTGFIETLLKEELILLRRDDIEIENLGIENVIELLSSDDDSNKYKQESNNKPIDYPSISKVGDIWQLGKHRIAHGDCLNREFVARLFDGKLAKVICTDPPYNLSMSKISSSNSPAERIDFAMASGEMTKEEFTQFLINYMKICHEFSQDNSTHYHFMDWRHLIEMNTAINNVYGELKALLVWCKDLSKPFPTSTYSNDHELIFMSRKGKEDKRHMKSNLLHYPCATSFANEDNKRDANTNCNYGNERLSIHPTPKPTSLISDIITDFSKESDIIFDPFIGSGTTLLACERTNRICYGIDIEGKYIDYILYSYKERAGKEPVKVCSNNISECQQTTCLTLNKSDCLNTANAELMN